MKPDRYSKRAKHKDERASPNVTMMLFDLRDIHVRLLSCFTQNDTIETWSCELDDVVEQIYQECKEPD